MIFGNIDRRRFNALAGYARHPQTTLITEELDWLSDPHELVLGMLCSDKIDHDYGWVVFGRDAMARFRAIDVNTSYPNADDARAALLAAMHEATTQPAAAYYQGDEHGEAVDFFQPVVLSERFHPSFKLLLEEPRYSPAKEIIAAMMRSHTDIDGNFIQKFQTAGWDALLWELYLFATFTELGFARQTEAATPDFVLHGNLGRLCVEATSVNPSAAGPENVPTDPVAFKKYVEDYIPIRISSSLRKKLNHRPHYWEQPAAKGLPFCIAVQDFHLPGSMRFIVPAATEYVFGVRHWLENGERKIARLDKHRYGRKRAQSGFFNLDGAENVSAVIINPQGTLTKFNRLGHAAGFGDPRVRMVRTGVKRNDANVGNPKPTPFSESVGPASTETWVEGMVVLHNPNARVPLDPIVLPGAAHEFLQDDGSIMSLLPDFHPLFSETQIALV